MTYRMTSNTDRGATLLELSATLTLFGVLLSVGLRGVGAVLDRTAVVAARESGLALVHRARAEAVRQGGTHLILDRERERALLLSGTSDTLAVESFGASGVNLDFSGSSNPVTLRWNSMGWGIVTSRTLVFTRAGDTARLVISSRGRGSRR